jgi:hypothetical protein
VAAICRSVTVDDVSAAFALRAAPAILLAALRPAVPFTAVARPAPALFAAGAAFLPTPPVLVLVTAIPVPSSARASVAEASAHAYNACLQPAIHCRDVTIVGDESRSLARQLCILLNRNLSA